MAKEVAKQPGHRMKIVKLQEMLDVSKAQSMLWSAEERIRDQEANREKNEIRRRKILAKQKIKQVKLSVADSGLPTLDDFAKVEPTFDVDKNIDVYVNVLCDEHNRMNGTVDKQQMADAKLQKEAKMTKDIMKNQKWRQDQASIKVKDKNPAKYALLDLYLKGTEKFVKSKPKFMRLYNEPTRNTHQSSYHLSTSQSHKQTRKPDEDTRSDLKIVEELFKQEPIVETKSHSQARPLVVPKRIKFEPASIIFEETKLLVSAQASTTSGSPTSKLKRSLTLMQDIEEASSTKNLCRQLNGLAESRKNLSAEQIKNLNICRVLLNKTEQLKEEIGNVTLGGSASTKTNTQFKILPALAKKLSSKLSFMEGSRFSINSPLKKAK